MNIFTRIKNNLEFRHHSKILSKAVAEMEKHEADGNEEELRKWVDIGLKSLEKCLHIPLE